MERVTITANYNGSPPKRPTIHSTAPLPFPPKPHLREHHFTSYLRPENPKPTSAEYHRLRREANHTTELSIFDAERYFNEGQDQTDTQSPKKGVIVDHVDLSPKPRESCVSSVDDGYGRNCRNGSFHATLTTSLEASWNSQTSLLANPPGSVAVAMRAFPLNEQRRGTSSACRWLFGRNCPCYGKKAVDVERKYSKTKSPNHLNFDSIGSVSLKKQSPKGGEVGAGVGGGDRAVPKELETGLSVVEMAKLKLGARNWACGSPDMLSPEKHFSAEIGRHRKVNSCRPFNDGGGVSFPILSRLTAAAGKDVNQPEDPPRNSLEVFRPVEEMVVSIKSAEFQRRTTMTMFPGDHGQCRIFTFPASPKAPVVAVDDDVASDTSSDLFEIESLSAQMTSCPMYRRRDSFNEMPGFDPRRFVGNAAGIQQLRRSLEELSTPSIAPSECYPPSEVSVEWSGTKSDAFDRGSVANFSSAASVDYEDVRFIQPDHHKLAMTVAAAAAGGGGRRRGNGLLSCRCEKAVSVRPNPVKLGPDQQHPMGSSMALWAEPGRATATGRAGNEGSMAHLPRVSDRPALAHSNSVRMSRPLPTQ